MVHCHAGHGQTGIAVALLLSPVGVTDDDIATDYSLSVPSVDESYARCWPGGAGEYLFSEGLTTATVANLRERLV